MVVDKAFYEEQRRLATEAQQKALQGEEEKRRLYAEERDREEAAGKIAREAYSIQRTQNILAVTCVLKEHEEALKGDGIVVTTRFEHFFDGLSGGRSLFVMQSASDVADVDYRYKYPHIFVYGGRVVEGFAHSSSGIGSSRWGWSEIIVCLEYPGRRAHLSPLAPRLDFDA